MRIAGKIFGQSRQDARPGFDQNDARRRRIDAAEIRSQCAVRDFGDRAGHFDAGRPAADDHKGQELAPLAFVVGDFRALKREQETPANEPRVFDALEARRRRRPIVMPEIGMRDAGREHQIIVRQRKRAGLHDIRGGVDRGHLRHQHAHIVLPAQDRTDRPGDIRGRQGGGRDLIEQRLETMMILPVDQDDIHRRAAQRLRGFKAGKAAANDHDFRTVRVAHGDIPPILENQGHQFR